ncbi:hypothetical protein ACP275_12G089600 [Erythranthe tilingii]
MDMAGKSTNVEPQNGGEGPLNYHTPNMSSSEWQVGVNNLTNSSVIGMIPMGNSMVDSSACSSGHMADSFHPPIWDQPINGQGLGIFLPPGMLPQFPADSGFIERAARFSCFGEMMSPFSSIHDHPLNPPYSSRGPGPMVVRGPHEGFERGPHEGLVVGPHEEVAKRGDEGSDDEAEFSGRGGGEEFSGKGAGGGKKRKRGGGQNSENEENNEAAKTASIETVKETEEIKRTSDQNPSSAGKSGGKNGKQGGSQSSDPPKEDYIHIRARRGQATNSHSLAERVRREKISERMKFLQDLVPGCSKVTGKAVMLDEIINYVQSLQRQVEFLSMKLATVNPRLDFNIEGLLAKDMIQPRGGGISSSSSMVFPTDMTMPFLPIHPSQIQACHPSNSSESLRRTINLQSTATVIGGFKEPTSSQVPTVWEDELHNVVHMGFNSSTPPNIQDLSGSLPPGHMKAEP